LVSQLVTGAKGRVLSSRDDLDLRISLITGVFTIGDTIYNSSNTSSARVFYANSTYLKLTNANNSVGFTNGNTINNGLSTTASITNAYPVLILSDITKTPNFTAGNNTLTIIGANSGANGVMLYVTPPDLIRETGKVLYMETSNTVIVRNINSTEDIKLVIKF